MSIILALLFFPGCALTQTTADKTEQIASSLQSKEFDEALELLRPALKNSPNDARLWAMQGTAYSGKHQNKDALVSFRNALKLSPDYLPALEGAIQIEFDSGSMEAIPLLKRVLRLRPTDATSHGMLAVLEYQKGDCAAAVPQFEKAGSLFDSRASALHAYATCLVKLKQFDHAAEVFQHTLSLAPDNPQERRLLASVQLMAHKPQDAIATLEPVLAGAHADTNTLELAANAYEDVGDTEKAVNTLKQAISSSPQDVGLYLDFAYLCFSHQSFQVGIDAVTDGIAQQPNAAQLYFARGVLYVQLAQYDKAESDLAKAYELDPKQSLTAAAQGLLAVQQNDLDRALADVREKLKHTPKDALLLYLQADILSQQGAEPGSSDFEMALRSARDSVRLRPALGPAHAVLAKLYLDSGKNQAAIDECRKALEVNPKDQTSLYRLIQALRKTGRTSEVPGLLKRLAQLRQDDAKQERQRNRYKLVEGGTP